MFVGLDISLSRICFTYCNFALLIIEYTILFAFLIIKLVCVYNNSAREAAHNYNNFSFFGGLSFRLFITFLHRNVFLLGVFFE